MDSSEHFLQTGVYFKKIVRISVKEKFWKFICFAAIIGFIVAIVLGRDALKVYDDAHSAFFTITSACIWIGIFNSIQSICKEHEIIRSEYRAGMRLSSYVFAHVRWQFLLSLMESIIVYVVLLAFGVLTGSHLGAGPIMGFFITILLLTFASSLMGLMVSAIAGTPTTAMTIMPFILIIQLVLCGVLFELKGVLDVIAVITFSKWGMNAFGSLANLNDRGDYPLKLTKEFGIQLPDTDKAQNKKPEFDSSFFNPLLAWFVILLIAAVCVAVAILSLKIKNRDS